MAKKLKLEPHPTYILGNGNEVKGVTTIIGPRFPQDALIGWAYRVGIEAMWKYELSIRMQDEECGELAIGPTSFESEIEDLKEDLKQLGLSYIAIRDDAGRVGTLAHHMIMCHLKGVEPDTSQSSEDEIGRAKIIFGKFLAWSKDHILDPIELEAPYVSEAYKYGGMIDCYAMLDGVPTILDWKTGGNVYPKDIVQVSAYWNLEIEQGNPVEQIVIVHFPLEGEVAEIPVDPKPGFKFFIFCLLMEDTSDEITNQLPNGGKR